MPNGEFAPEDLEHVVNERRVECFGGPRDGDFCRADANGRERGGFYIPINLHPCGFGWVHVAFQWVPDE